MNSELFTRIRDECPDVMSRVVAVSGDVSLPSLGLSPSDEEKLLEEVDIAVHGAATLWANTKLKDAISVITEGTFRVLQLCKKMKKLQLVVHVSTAFCHCDLEVLEEKTYPSPHDPMDVIQLTHWLPDNILENITPELLKPHPSSYIYSKRLSETLVANHYPELPACIVRPSIVLPAWREPLKGWVDHLNRPILILVGVATGLIRSLRCYSEYNAEVIPVDMAVNGIITAIFSVASSQQRPKEIPVFNLTQGKTYPIKWGVIMDRGKQVVREYPSEIMASYPNVTVYSNKFLHELSTIYLHWLRAYFYDFLSLVFGKERHNVKFQRMIQEGLDAVQYITTREWKFCNDKLLQLRSSLNGVDRERFFLDFEKIEMQSYLTSTVLGGRHYILKQDPKSLPRCRLKLKILYVVDKLVSFLFLLLAWKLVSTSDKASAVLDSVIAAALSVIPFFTELHHN